MILDCFTFFNELDILEGRLEYLYPRVDWFVIVETDHTHSGHPKPLNYLANIKRYQKYSDKILYMPFAADITQWDFSYRPTQMDGESAHWKLENFQRNYISHALELFPKDAMVLVSDVDEIPSIHSINLAESILGKAADVFTLEQDLFYYNFSQKQPQPWAAAVITSAGVALQQTPQVLRMIALSGNMPRIFNGGWHLSYWGGVDRIREKITSFAHQELNHPEFTDTEKIRNRVMLGQDPYDRGAMVTVDPESIPSDIRNIFGKFSVTVN